MLVQDIWAAAWGRKVGAMAMPGGLVQRVEQGKGRVVQGMQGYTAMVSTWQGFRWGEGGDV